MKPLSLFLATSSLLLSAASVSVFAENTPAKIEADMQRVLDVLASLKGKPIEDLTPEEARRQPTPADAVKKLLQDSGKSSATDASIATKAISIPGPLGSIPATTFTPKGDGPFPVLVYFHGGGFVIANSKTYAASAQALAKGANAIVLSVDYHQAPENKFPAAPNDAFAAYQWAIGHAKEINGDPQRVAVGGESAGANLAAVVTLMARDKKIQLPAHQLLIYPVVSDDMNSPSYKQHEYAKPLNKAMMKWFFKYYEGDPQNSYALPLKAKSLKSLPPATVITAEIDPLQSEGAAYADRLKTEGVNVSYREFKGVTHEFFGMGAVVKKAQEAQEFATTNLKKAFGN